MKFGVNTEIALTHILTRKRQTLVAAMGVTIGIALYIFSNSLIKGFDAYSRVEMFKTVPHIRIYKEDKISKPLFAASNSNATVVVVNPKIIRYSKSIIDPDKLVNDIKTRSYVLNASPQVNVDIFYTNGKSQLPGVANGVRINEADAMFNIHSTMLAGSLEPLESNFNAVVIGKGVAEKMNVGLGDNLTIFSSKGVYKVLKVVGIFSIGNKSTDESKCYVNLTTAQQLLQERPDYVADIYVSVVNPDSSIQYARSLQEITSYKVEDWQSTNADTMASNKIRAIMNSVVGFAIMMIAAFGIYNILNMTITQKMNDIAILKATGFKGKDVIRIFVLEAFIMGLVGTILGVSLATVLIHILSKVYIGPPTGYFPIAYELSVYITGITFGLLASLGAGFFPARKAANVDPVEIFRK